MEFLHGAASIDISHLPEQGMRFGALLAQEVLEDPDVLGQIRDAWNNFIETGQIWALIIGLFLGYIVKSFLG